MKKQTALLKRGAEAPAELLDRTIVATQVMSATLSSDKMVKKTNAYWHMLGPGLTTGASDDDPSGIATYSQAGAKYGFQLLWLAPLTFPLMATVQEMCARIGMVTGRGLAGNIRVHFNKRLLYLCTTLLFAANALNIGADLGAMAKAVQLLNPQINFGLLVVGFALASMFMQIFTPYVRYARYLKWLALILLSYVFSTLMAHLDWSNVLHHAVIPSIHFDKDQLFMICAILGTTISPYLFFWQTSQEVEEQILQGKTTLAERQTATAAADIKSMRIDVWSGMFLSNLVMFFIIAACGALLFTHGITNIQTTAQAAQALRPFAGDATYFLFSIGLIGTGLLAIPVLAGSSSYAISESFRWKEGLYRNLRQAYAFYGVIIISMLVGLGLNFVGIDPIKALIYAAVANGLVAPVILFFIVTMSSNKKIMGRWTNKRSTTIIGWIVTLLMFASGVAAIISLV
ncbi:MAG: natural resistance-associated macrophage protein [Candidatus Saccharibacteria bacterium]|nr:natural resistance-associated macrophage protein [Candidatus Saccharibacteria bacterium]